LREDPCAVRDVQTFVTILGRCDRRTVPVVNVRGDVAQKELKAVRRAVQGVEKARARLRDAALAAARSGESVQDIGDWAGMSKTSAQRLLDEARRLEREAGE
jgi:hypothetical protein